MDRNLYTGEDIRKKVYIKLYYSMLDWQWYNDANTFRVFMHLMLTANRKDRPYLNNVIHRGESLASIQNMSGSLNISIQSVRTALNHLKSTNEITIRKIGKTSVIRLNNYNKYQSDNRIFNNESTTNQQRANNESTTLINCNNDNNDILKECAVKTHAHGKHKNVMLTDEEYRNFRNAYPTYAADIIEELSDKIATGDSRYKKGHIGHLYVFARYHKPIKHLDEDDEPSYDIELALQRSLNIDPTMTKRKIN